MLSRRQLVRTFAAAAVAGVATHSSANEARWPAEKQVGNFHCHADYQLGRDELLLNQLGELSRDIVDILGLPPSREPMHLFLFHNQETYQAYLRQHFPRVPFRRAIYIKSKGPGMVFAAKGEEFEIDVRHECTHAVLHTVLTDLPLWLDEGLAEYFEVARFDRASRNPHLAELRKELRVKPPRALAELEAITDFADLGRGEYRDSFGWVHFLLHGPRDAHEELVAYLGDQQAGQPLEKLGQRLRRRVTNLEQQFVEHFRP